MVGYSPASSLGWLDFDAAASDRAATLLRAFEEPGTLDPIGLGSIRDAFSELLSPGTSTVQTRLRYFIFLPWIFQRLERERVGPTDFPRRLRHLEATLIDCLRHLGPNQGVQGFTSGKDLQRMPSEAYWGGLGSWGVRRLDLTIAEYGQRISSFGRRPLEVDDDGNPVRRASPMWARLPEPPEDFLASEETFHLRPEEAATLVDLIRRYHPRSLLAVATAFPGVAAEAERPWDLPPERLTGELRHVLHHARCASELLWGPQLLYNLLLARRAEAELRWDTSALVERLDAILGTWTEQIVSRHGVYRAWADDLDGFWDVLGGPRAIPEPTRDFVSAMVRRVVQDPHRFVTDREVHGLIRDREVALKGGRARLATLTALEGWNQQPFGSPLVYRWPITRSYLADLADGLGAAE